MNSSIQVCAKPYISAHNLLHYLTIIPYLAVVLHMGISTERWMSPVRYRIGTLIISDKRFILRLIVQKDAMSSSRPKFCSLPLEVLSELFEIGKKWEMERLADDSSQDQMPFELLVSQICSHIRRVALSTPRIWTSIAINPSSMRERVVAYVARSASAWLDIRVDMMQFPSSTDEKKMAALLDIITPESHRWRRLSILRLLEVEGQAIVKRICNCYAPSLKHLSLMVEQIDGANPFGPDSDVRSFQLFNSTSQLQFLRLRGMALHLFHPRLDSVVVLHLDETRNIPLTYDKFREMALSSPSLAHLSIYGDIVHPEFWCQNDIPLPSLRSLRICSVSGSVYTGILLSLDMPKLECLTLKRLREHDLDALEIFEDGTKFSNLKCLKFWDFDVSVYTYERLIKVFRNIASFSTLHSGIFDCHLVELLLDQSGLASTAEIPLWPTLKMLSFPLCSDEKDVEVAENLIRSREIDGCPISTIMLCASAEDDLETIIESGVKGVRVIYTSRRDTWPANFVEYDQDDIFLC